MAMDDDWLAMMNSNFIDVHTAYTVYVRPYKYWHILYYDCRTTMSWHCTSIDTDVSLQWHVMTLYSLSLYRYSHTPYTLWIIVHRSSSTDHLPIKRMDPIDCWSVNQGGCGGPTVAFVAHLFKSESSLYSMLSVDPALYSMLSVDPWGNFRSDTLWVHK